jgi:hypothetical protein
MNDLKPIETVYNGYRFRSRLEARWAVFFDAFGIKYEYEKEGYDLGDAGYYLPDFWLPDLDMFVEAKGQQPTELEEEKARRLVLKSGKTVGLVGAVPCGYEDLQTQYFGYVYWSSNGKVAEDATYCFCKCHMCGTYGYEFDGLIRRKCGCGNEKIWVKIKSDDEYTLYERSCAKARQARFEHGEHG